MENVNVKGYLPVGTLVTCKITEEPYSYRYMPPEKQQLFTPGKIGTIAAIAPKVRISPLNERHDRKPYFYCVDWNESGVSYRAGINHCNLVKI